MNHGHDEVDGEQQKLAVKPEIFINQLPLIEAESLVTALCTGKNYRFRCYNQFRLAEKAC